MDQNITQIAYKEGIFQLDSNAFQMDKAISVGLNPVMKIDKTSEDLLSLLLPKIPHDKILEIPILES